MRLFERRACICIFLREWTLSVDRRAVCHRIVETEKEASEENPVHAAILKTLVPQTETL